MTNHIALETGMKNISPLLIELIRAGQTVKMTVTGNSMYPFLRHLKDSVLLTGPSRCPIKKGRIVLVCKPDGSYVLHRIVKLRGDCFWMLGDAQTMMEGPFSTDSIIATVKNVSKKRFTISTDSIIATVKNVSKKRFTISTDSCLWRSMSFLWHLLLPIRSSMFRCIRFISIIKTRITKNTLKR
mgnify:CR=1 FL=1